MDIILIGMPGCGKTQLGRMLANKLTLGFCDIDEYIEKDEEMSISEIFEKRGESAFREAETCALMKNMGRGRVISTGGGVVKNPVNILAMKKHGVVVFIDRPIENIMSDVDTASRPLLSEGRHRLLNLYAERIDIYKSAADVIINNDSDMETAVEKIIKEVEKHDNNSN